MNNLEITRREWCSAQDKYTYEAIANSIEFITMLPEDAAVGSNCICPDGIYFLFPTGEWKKI